MVILCLMLNEKQVRMGAKCRLALRCVTWQSAPLHVCLFRFRVVCDVRGEELPPCQFMKRPQTPPYSRHTAPVLFTSSAPPVHLLLQHLAPSLPGSPLNHSSSPPYLSLLSVSLQDSVHLQRIHFHSLATDSLRSGCPWIRHAA